MWIPDPPEDLNEFNEWKRKALRTIEQVKQFTKKRSMAFFGTDDRVHQVDVATDEEILVEDGDLVIPSIDDLFLDVTIKIERSLDRAFKDHETLFAGYAALTRAQWLIPMSKSRIFFLQALYEPTTKLIFE